MTPPSARSRAKTQYQGNGFYFDPDSRQTPVNFEDADQRGNYLNAGDLSLPEIGPGNGLVYNDFDYIGFQTRGSMRSTEQFNTLDVTPKARGV